ncbi:hypothetical protein I4F81_008408 [Pyropia yezoensis]|uniref:Uncharacterized protein n=1 Tax=Pyropia yezoensis TaxID=2788 RepID=A0ACC3C6Z8_PYRYE|nr:hypothetical protein I4F81_008408 [Neopyropia yezoensis]
MKMRGYNGSQLCDKAFASQALVRAGVTGDSATLSAAHAYVEVSQPSRLRDAVDMLLSYHNPGSGGWATDELTRSYAWVEALNPSEVFGDNMIDYLYVECTSAAVTALRAYRAAPVAVAGPGAATYRAAEVAAAIASGVALVVRAQRANGSWYGSWGVCFTNVPTHIPCF